MLLQSVLVGKAREVYSALSVEQSVDYELVKREILKAYELVPEAYRQQFRDLKCNEGQTYMEFAQQKEAFFNRWCTSQQVGNSFDKLKQLVLLEEFKGCVPVKVKTYLEEQKVEELQRAATLADDYKLTHQSTSSAPEHKSDTTPKFKGTTAVPPRTGDRNHHPRDQDQSGHNRGMTLQSGPVCAYCKRRGHLLSECWALERKDKKKGNALVTTSGHSSRKVAAKTPDTFKPFLSQGSVSIEENDVGKSIQILRDTGASQSLLAKGVLALSEQFATGETVLIHGVELGFACVPLHRVFLKSDLVSGPILVGVQSTLPVEGVSLLLGNDLAGAKVMVDPCLCSLPFVSDSTNETSWEIPGLFPACAVTRAMAKQADKQSSLLANDPVKSQIVDLSDTFLANDNDLYNNCSTDDPEDDANMNCPVPTNQLIERQQSDPELIPLVQDALCESEAAKVPVCFYIRSGVLMRKWRPPTAAADAEWLVSHQIVVPNCYREDILSLAHGSPLAGHLGINKTYQKVVSNFYWPGLHKDVVKFCRSCHTCQVVGKPNQKPPVAPLRPIPTVGEPFSRVLVDCVGPLPKTKSGNSYLLTIMCVTTRFPEAIPLWNIKAHTIIKALIRFFTLVGLPKHIQSDQGSNFMSTVFQQVMHQLNITQHRSSAYHPQSQGAIERFHQTLKTMMRSYCFDNQKDWDEGIHLLVFAARESVQETLGFSPFELVFGHVVRGPLKILKESWLVVDSDPVNLLEYVTTFKTRLFEAGELAKKNLSRVQTRMKVWYVRKARERVFDVGDKVLVLLPIVGNPLQARYHGPYTVERRVNDVDYVVSTPDRRKERQLCHINVLKEYHTKDDSSASKSVAPVASLSTDKSASLKEDEENLFDDFGIRLNNSQIISNLKSKLGHLSHSQAAELEILIQRNLVLFPDVPSRADVVCHDVDVGNADPIKQHPYRVNPEKRRLLRQEVEYMLKNDLIERSYSAWSSPCILVPKTDKTFRFCTDFRKVNALTKPDSYPLPRIEDCIDRIGYSKYVSKFDMLKGYWQVPLSGRAKEMSAFVTPDGLFQYKVMPFGMRNAPATFQRFINQVTAEVEGGCEAYIDDVIIYSDNWSDHVKQLRTFFDKLKEAKLTVNLAKSEFGCAQVSYLGHIVGQGEVKPIDAKVKAISQFPIPRNKKELMRYLGMAGYYRRFCKNFSVIVEPLTNLLHKRREFTWSEECQAAFE
ncbi:uncharacterized protein [Dysidea avara]|uniref:uncharacterized protein n=1 Tax=Dysidea avara TaxID=196820 RepID=UPI00332AAFDB